MASFLLGAALLAGFFCAHVAAASASLPQEALKERILALIDDLGAEEWEVREKAQKALVEIGTPALPFLRRALYDQDPEIRHRAQAVLALLAGLSAWNQEVRRKLATARVSVNFDQTPLEKTLAELARKSGVVIEISPPLRRLLQKNPLPVTFQIEDYNLDLALLHVLRQKKLTYSLAFDTVIVEGGTLGQTTVIAGALDTRIPAGHFQDLDLNGLAKELRRHLPVDVAVEAAAFGRKEVKINLKTQKPLRLETILSLCLEGYELGYVFDEKRLIITTGDRSKDTLLTERFDLTELIRTMDENRQEPVENIPQKVKEALEHCVDRVSWREGPEKASIQVLGNVLVVRHKLAVLEQVRTYLEQLLRAEKERQKNPALPPAKNA